MKTCVKYERQKDVNKASSLLDYSMIHSANLNKQSTVILFVSNLEIQNFQNVLINETFVVFKRLPKIQQFIL